VWTPTPSEVMVPRKTLLVGGLAIVLVGLLAGILYLTKKPTLRGGVIDPPLPAADIQLTDFNGLPFALSSLRGNVVIVYFGYTNCQTECPLTMAHLKLALQSLGDKASDVRVVMVSTDPAHDTPQAMKEFLGKFDPKFIGLVGTPEQLAKVWKDYGVTVEDGGETHSFFLYVIDRSGNFRETFLPDSLPADEAADLVVLLGQK
jgi:protein SCO1/2